MLYRCSLSRITLFLARVDDSLLWLFILPFAFLTFFNISSAFLFVPVLSILSSALSSQRNSIGLTPIILIITRRALIDF